MAKKDKDKTRKSYSHTLLTQESILIWIMTLAFIALAFYCVSNGYTGSLPWLDAMVSFPWASYGVSQFYYYKKSMAENTKDGIKFETVLEEVKQAYGKTQVSGIDWNVNDYTPSTPSYDSSTIGTTQSIDIDYGI